MPRRIYGSAFIPNLYDLFGWNHAYRYRITGFRKQKGDEAILLFDLEETEALIPKSVLKKAGMGSETPDSHAMDADHAVGTGTHVLGYPNGWGENFGSDYYRQAQIMELARYEGYGFWAENRDGEPVQTGPVLNVTSPAALNDQINKLIEQMEREGKAKA